MTCKAFKPTISINLRKPLIRINKDTLHLIGDPEYILLLVNPNDCSLGISPATKTDPKAHCLSKYNKRKTMELYSKSLINNLLLLSPEWNIKGTYKIKGIEIKQQPIIKFKMSEAVEIRGIK